MNSWILIFVLLSTCFALQGVVELNDSNFHQLVSSASKPWLVMFSASWCDHCTHLKPQLQKLSPQLAQLGVTIGLVGQNNEDLIIDYVMDRKTHELSYPKLIVFVGKKKVSDVPVWLRTAPQLLEWFRSNISLKGAEQL